MPNLEVIIANIQKAKAVLTDDDLRKLPHRKAYIYGRVSTAGQVRDSHESIMDLSRLVDLAKRDGYRSQLEPPGVAQWLESIQNNPDLPRILVDGDLTIDCRDLGLSGALTEDKRPGLSDLQKGVAKGEIGATYLTEGMSRLSRDRDLVLGYQLLKLFKEHRVRIRTPAGVFNPAIPRDWDYLAMDVEKSAAEMTQMGIRLGWRRHSKAASGKHVGTVVCPGYYVTIEGQKRDGSFILGRWAIYEPHRQVVLTALQELVRQQSVFKAAQVLHARGIVFPPFEKEYAYMESRSVLRQYRKNDQGSVITADALQGLATNLALVGIWQWKDILLLHNHPPAVPLELFEQAYSIATSTQPRGRAAYPEVMEWAGLLYCYNHKTPVRLSAYNKRRQWACNRDHQAGLGESCLYIEDHLLTPPLTQEFLHYLDLLPHAQTVLEKLKSQVDNQDLELSRRHREEMELLIRIANLEKCLGSGDPEKEETYWRQIREVKANLELVRQRPLPPKATGIDLERVAHFLENLRGNWEKYSTNLRRRLLKLLIDRVELRHDLYHLDVVICWKTGFRQAICIDRPTACRTKEKRWRLQDDQQLKSLWSSASWEEMLAAMPGRTAASIRHRASRLKLERQVKIFPSQIRRWTVEDDSQLRKMYTEGKSLNDISQEVERTVHSVRYRLSWLGITRPPEVCRRPVQPTWETQSTRVMQGLPSQYRLGL